jgi:hypothetical protein
MPPPELVNMFAVPFSFSRHPGHAQLNPALKRFILAQEKSGAAANPPFSRATSTCSVNPIQPSSS